ncbi:uncharacterized protein K452DRAFT_290297 [Aplosporella prunicola CBS 121167]|uniref:Uncharacterized protein n=1 Tax=Aplosporella prunicola CBS 121167 TaxID=1176127 RepID=A0A6A6B5W6_9PEZI|nr:uncharacterized protein K452DRAFT_290297 [Aplosporella prunicola CBS 121167]KAF2138644.1 hypothetical protein K452DRAFT_290297 [Aplosporella prunicola CBS 121167]
MPSILRPQENGDYRFCGQCYVHGIMYGEVIDMWERGELGEQETFRLVWFRFVMGREVFDLPSRNGVRSLVEFGAFWRFIWFIVVCTSSPSSAFSF